MMHHILIWLVGVEWQMKWKMMEQLVWRCSLCLESCFSITRFCPSNFLNYCVLLFGLVTNRWNYSLSSPITSPTESLQDDRLSLIFTIKQKILKNCNLIPNFLVFIKVWEPKWHALAVPLPPHIWKIEKDGVLWWIRSWCKWWAPLNLYFIHILAESYTSLYILTIVLVRKE